MDRKELNDITDRMRLKRRFEEFARDILPGEGFADDEITDACIRMLCARIGAHEELIEHVKDVADQWFEGDR
jgi:hypothetical protein